MYLKPFIESLAPCGMDFVEPGCDQSCGLRPKRKLTQLLLVAASEKLRDDNSHGAALVDRWRSVPPSWPQSGLSRICGCLAAESIRNN
ncbi:MAG: hypothetical protein LKE33_07765 [Acidaminococcus sp.]|nr:hypothetical protein [Acidaminococcus sp.]